MDILRFLVWLMILIHPTLCYYQNPDEVKPEFYSPLENITASQGRDVEFTCVVNRLADYRVAWIKSDTKAILAIHNRLVAHNHRLSVTHNGHNTWKLHIYNIQRNDTGTYMCQLNTNPMRWQLGYLNVTVPPDIINDEEPPEGYQALEGGTIRIRCRGTGIPEPRMSWKREDNKPIIVRNDKQIEMRAVVLGEHLTLTKVNRSDMGVYLCLAKSSVPPIVSKRFAVRVNFKPRIDVQDQLIVVPVKKNVSMVCTIEASPKATMQWINNRGEPILPNSKMNITELKINEYTVKMELWINSIEEREFGEYTCVSENTIGKAEGYIRIQPSLMLEESTKSIQYTVTDESDEKYKKYSGRYVESTKKPQSKFSATGGKYVPTNSKTIPISGSENKFGNKFENKHNKPILPKNDQSPLKEEFIWIIPLAFVMHFAF